MELVDLACETAGCELIGWSDGWVDGWMGDDPTNRSPISLFFAAFAGKRRFEAVVLVSGEWSTN